MVTHLSSISYSQEMEMKAQEITLIGSLRLAWGVTNYLASIAYATRRSNMLACYIIPCMHLHESTCKVLWKSAFAGNLHVAGPVPQTVAVQIIEVM